MRGAGDTVTPMWISLFTTICLRVPLAYCLAWPPPRGGRRYTAASGPGHRLWRRAAAAGARATGPGARGGVSEALFFSLLIPWVLGAVISAVAYRRGGWRKALDQPL